MLLDSPYLVTPGKKFKLSDVKTDDTGPFKDKHEAQDAIDKNLKKLDELQELLYAEAKHAVLIVLQAMDTGGKDGAISHVFSGVNPQGCSVTSFKVPTELEKAHDFLWRIHAAVPRRGMIGIFNRSHYESVLVERVHDLVPKEVWSGRYEHINHFEQLLADEGVTDPQVLPAHLQGGAEEAARGPARRPRQALEVQRQRPEGAGAVGRLPGRLRGRAVAAAPPRTRRGSWSPPTTSGSATGSSPTPSSGR